MKLKYFPILLVGISALLFVGCKKDDPIVTGGTNGTDTVKTFSIPTYTDDYSSISSWSNRDNWNLANVHDPSVAYYNGYYYMYGTDASYGNAAEGHGHFQGKRSKDLVNWDWVGGPFYNPPTWVADSLNAIRTRMGLSAIDKSNIQYGYWAPVVRKVSVGGKDILRMYYSIVIFNLIKTGNIPTYGTNGSMTNFDGSWTERAFIGMCESTDPAGAVWTDKGFVTTSSSDRGLDYNRANTSDWSAYFYYNAIDPTYIVSPEGKHYLIHGSWHSGFALLQLDPTSGKPLNKLGNPWASTTSDLTSRYGVRVGTRTASSRWQGSEAPEVIYKDGFYYLFMAYDGLDVPYNTRVVRSTNIEGPYLDITGRNFTSGSGDCYPIVTHPYKFNLSNGWVGISHCCVFQKENTNDWFLMSQGRLPANVGGNAYSNALMMGHVRRLVWCPASTSEPSNLWPIALPERYAAVPDYGTITKDSLTGTWEHINLKYSYGVQDIASALTLNVDGTMSGALTGNWSYDATKKQLTLGNVVVCVEREVDWEATPRRVTIVYAGTEKNLNATYWGKKKK